MHHCAAGPKVEALEARLLLDGSTPAVELFGASPALFAENQGQWADEAVHYAFQRGGAGVAFTDDGLAIRLAVPVETGDATPEGGLPDRLPPTEYLTASLAVRFEGANVVMPAGLDLQETVFNYFVGDQANWRSGVATYAGIGYAGLYDGIDLEVSGDAAFLKYAFHVAPGADWGRIGVTYDGAAGPLEISATGDLLIHTAAGDLIDRAPVAWQDISGQRVAVAVTYQLLDADTVGFALSGDYDPSAELIIDPELAWSTYLGGSGGDRGNGVAVDSVGNVYMTGYTKSAGLATPGAYETTHNGNWDAFVAKFNAIGNMLMYFTYLGADEYIYGEAIVVDSDENVYITGATSSSGLATAGAYDTTYNGGVDAFAAKFDAAGSTLVYFTYLGGSGRDWGYDIAADASGNAYVTGRTNSSGLATAGAYDTTYNGGGDAFVAEFNATGSTLACFTYLGGSGDDGGAGIAVDSGGNAYVAGSTYSADLATAGAYDATYRGGGDAFVAKFSAAGDTLAYFTYLGGGGDDGGSDIAVDPGGNAYVTGWTISSGLATAGAYDMTYDADYSCCDAFVAKFDATGSALAYFTYLGGSEYDSGAGIAVDFGGNAHVTGWTASSGLATDGAYDTTYGGTWLWFGDAFVAKFNATASTLVYYTYLGGGDGDVGVGIAVDFGGNVYVTGGTDSSNLATAGAYDTTVDGGSGDFGLADAFMAKFSGLAEPTPLVWQGGASAYWDEAANWFPAIVPGSSNLTVFDGTPAANQPSLRQDENVRGIDIRSAGWTISMSGNTLRVGDGGLAIAGGSTPTSRVDLGTGNLIVDYAAGGPNPAAQIRDWVKAGYNSPARDWNGNGIMSSVAAGDANLLTAVGVIDNTDPLVGGRTTFEGQEVDASSILLKYTYWGDANFDGRINFDDYDISDYYYWFPAPAAQMGWWTGDFDMDGDVDFDDYDKMDYAYWFQGVPLGGLEAAAVGPAIARIEGELLPPAANVAVTPDADASLGLDAALVAAALPAAGPVARVSAPALAAWDTWPEDGPAAGVLALASPLSLGTAVHSVRPLAAPNLTPPGPMPDILASLATPVLVAL